MVKFTFLRHAEGVHNADAHKHGPIAYTFPKNHDAPLTVEGWEQVNRANGIINISDFTHVYCSPLLRCRQTLLGVEPMAPAVAVKLDDRLMEPQGEHICNKRTEKSDLNVSMLWNTDGVSDVNPWGLGADSLHDRVVSITEELRRKYPDSKILIVSHYEWIREWFRIYEQKDVSLENCAFAHGCI
jgi:broad specificity phosphatase PhoE